MDVVHLKIYLVVVVQNVQFGLKLD